MSASEVKKMGLLRIFQILNDYSDAEHPLTQQDIIDKLNLLYGINLERKAVASNIDLLCDADCEVVKTRKGCYLANRRFEDSEVHFLIDSVLSNQNIKSAYTDDLVRRLTGLSNVYFRSHAIRSVYPFVNKSDNSELFMSIDSIYKAMDTEVNIKYDYNYYGTDFKLHKSSTQIVSPYKLIFHNMGYYLVAYSVRFNDIVFHRLDHMTNVSILNEPAKPMSSLVNIGIAPDYFKAARPYMFSDNPERVVMYVNNDPIMISQLIDWFGRGITISETGDDYGTLCVELRASPKAMKIWALQYADSVEITEPAELREEIRLSLLFALEKYEKS